MSLQLAEQPNARSAGPPNRTPSLGWTAVASSLAALSSGVVPPNGRDAVGEF